MAPTRAASRPPRAEMRNGALRVPCCLVEQWGQLKADCADVGEPPAQPLLPAPGAGAEGNLDCVAWLVASALARDLLVWAKDLFR
jgi:hypothetical protein